MGCGGSKDASTAPQQQTPASPTKAVVEDQSKSSNDVTSPIEPSASIAIDNAVQSSFNVEVIDDVEPEDGDLMSLAAMTRQQKTKRSQRGKGTNMILGGEGEIVAPKTVHDSQTTTMDDALLEKQKQLRQQFESDRSDRAARREERRKLTEEIAGKEGIAAGEHALLAIKQKEAMESNALKLDAMLDAWDEMQERTSTYTEKDFKDVYGGLSYASDALTLTCTRLEQLCNLVTDCADLAKNPGLLPAAKDIVEFLIKLDRFYTKTWILSNIAPIVIKKNPSVKLLQTPSNDFFSTVMEIKGVLMNVTPGNTGMLSRLTKLSKTLIPLYDKVKAIICEQYLPKYNESMTNDDIMKTYTTISSAICIDFVDACDPRLLPAVIDALKPEQVEKFKGYLVKSRLLFIDQLGERVFSSKIITAGAPLAKYTDNKIILDGVCRLFQMNI